ncbi:uncharacterized protein B0I36DRAFT_356096 [Microdochium trichocladiopsis]|uniref:Uncharacterized protein n=1 Tax=Microdochium trichocladiopsis TaxID=1682393 RepID=A0A9P9BIW6_9PEZI|nr:uncharacterized protein B0I36DRAFT_356096 [Microdochium trichocladiopsis]KAH7012728.1 hypothetical protein B0I36DRAFT_356096 [Microdochium trichocladiopsis]
MIPDSPYPPLHSWVEAPPEYRHVTSGKAKKIWDKRDFSHQPERDIRQGSFRAARFLQAIEGSSEKSSDVTATNFREQGCRSAAMARPDHIGPASGDMAPRQLLAPTRRTGDLGSGTRASLEVCTSRVPEQALVGYPDGDFHGYEVRVLQYCVRHINAPPCASPLNYLWRLWGPYSRDQVGLKAPFLV